MQTGTRTLAVWKLVLVVASVRWVQCLCCCVIFAHMKCIAFLFTFMPATSMTEYYWLLRNDHFCHSSASPGRQASYLLNISLDSPKIFAFCAKVLFWVLLPPSLTGFLPYSSKAYLSKISVCPAYVGNSSRAPPFRNTYTRNIYVSMFLYAFQNISGWPKNSLTIPDSWHFQDETADSSRKWETSHLLAGNPNFSEWFSWSCPLASLSLC